MAVNYGLLRRYVSDGSFTAEVLMTFLTQLVKPSVSIQRQVSGLFTYLFIGSANNT